VGAVVGSIPRLLLAGLGGLLAAILIVAGFLLHRASFDARHTLPVAGWAHLRTVDIWGAFVDLVEEYREVSPPASIEPAVPDECRVRSGDQLETAVAKSPRTPSNTATLSRALPSTSRAAPTA